MEDGDLRSPSCGSGNGNDFIISLHSGRLGLSAETDARWSQIRLILAVVTVTVARLSENQQVTVA